MPYGANSYDSVCVRLITPAFAVPYAASWGDARSDRDAPMLTMDPADDVSIMAWAKTVQPRNVGRRLKSTTSRHSSSSTSSDGRGSWPRRPPTLFTTTSTLPRSFMRPAVSVNIAASVTSPTMGTTSPGSAAASLARAADASPSMSTENTGAPSRAKASTQPLPMPLAPPVTTTFLPVSPSPASTPEMVFG